MNLLAEQLKKSLNESDLIRGRLERKEEELLDVKRMLKYKHDEFGELTIRLSLNEKKIESLQKESDERAAKHQQTLEEVRIDLQKKIKYVFCSYQTLRHVHSHRQCEEEIAVLHNDNEQLEDDNKKLKERLKQLTKTKLMDDLMQKKIGGAQRSTGVSSKKVQRESLFIDDLFFHQVQLVMLIRVQHNVNYHLRKFMKCLQRVNKK